MTARRFEALLVIGLAAGCSLSSDVSISPLLMPQTNVERGTDANSMLRKADYVRLVLDTSRPASKNPKASTLSPFKDCTI